MSQNDFNTYIERCKLWLISTQNYNIIDIHQVTNGILDAKRIKVPSESQSDLSINGRSSSTEGIPVDAINYNYDDLTEKQIVEIAHQRYFSHLITKMALSQNDDTIGPINDYPLDEFDFHNYLDTHNDLVLFSKLYHCFYHPDDDIDDDSVCCHRRYAWYINRNVLSKISLYNNDFFNLNTTHLTNMLFYGRVDHYIDSLLS